MLKFVGKTAIVTGAGGGLGRQYALELAKRGCNVVVNDTGGGLSGDRSTVSDAAGLVVKEIQDAGGVAVANRNSVLEAEAIVEQAKKSFGKIDVVINNAGILRDKSFHKMSKDEWRAVIDTHLNGTFEMCHAVWPLMQQQNYGRIVNVGSGAGLYGNFGQANYSAAKMAILGLTNTLAKEGEKYNISVNCVVPIAGSRMTATVLPSNMLELLDPKHISPLVAYLSHEDCSTSGQTFEVGGGWYSQVRWERSVGVTLAAAGVPATVEVIQTNLGRIGDFSRDSTYPTSAADALRDMISSAASSPDAVIDSKNMAISSVAIAGSVIFSNVGGGISLKSDTLFLQLQNVISKDSASASELVAKIGAKIQFDITGAGSHKKRWIVDATGQSTGPGVRLHSGDGEGRAGVLIICSDETFLAMVSGKLSPEYAYMSGSIVVKGNATIALKVKYLLDLAAKDPNRIPN